MTAMNMVVRFTRSKVSRWLYCTGPFRSMVRLRLGKHCENYIFKEWKAGTNSKMCSNKSGGKQNGSTSKEKSFLPEDTIVWLDWVVLKSEVPWAFTNQVPCQRIVWWTTGLPWWLSVKNLPLMQETIYSAGDLGSIPGLGRSSGEGNGNPLRNSCLGNLTDRGGWQATVHEAARVGHDWATKPPPKPSQKCPVWFKQRIIGKVPVTVDLFAVYVAFSYKIYHWLSK